MIHAISYRAPKSPMAESYRAIVAGLHGVNKKESPITIEITSSVSGAGKSTVAANLAIVMAQTGAKVLLVDCNFSHRVQHEFFGLRRQGLSDCVASGGELSAFRQATAQPGLDLVAAGDADIVAISPEAMEQILSTAASGYDYILLDADSILESASALSFAEVADGALFVVKSGEDRPKDARLAKKRLGQAKTPILGCILNCVKVSADDVEYYREQDESGQ